jgi:hypothetical protein
LIFQALFEPVVSAQEEEEKEDGDDDDDDDDECTAVSGKTIGWEIRSIR